MSTRADTDTLAFAEKLLALLGEARVATTYKYAVLLALLDICMEQTSSSGAAPEMITTRQLAEKVVELYWPQTAPFAHIDARILDQSATGQAEVDGEPKAAWQARARQTHEFEKLVRFVEWKLVEMPLPRLQRMGETEVSLLYRIYWGQGVKLREFNSKGFDNRILLLSGVGDHLVRLSGLLRPLIQRQWAAMVARINRDLVPDAQLDDHLFGVSRVTLKRVLEPLVALQGARCFYCERRLGSAVEVDHFLPWSRYGSDDLENLVAAHSTCNGPKSDYMAAARHVRAWAARARERASALSTIADETRWTYNPGTPLSVARAVYLRLPSDAKLWNEGKVFVDLDRPMLVQALVS